MPQSQFIVRRARALWSTASWQLGVKPPLFPQSFVPPIVEETDGRVRIGYIPWIREHGDRVIAQIAEAAPEISFVDLGLFVDISRVENRRQVLLYAEKKPVAFRAEMLERLAKWHSAGLQAVVLTHDWAPAMREVVHACRAVGLPTVLIPHESVFAHRKYYYRHPRTNVDTPLCDMTLCWGALQHDIFVSRGYPKSRLKIVGSPKLDVSMSARRRLSSSAFRSLHGLRDDGRPLVLFAAQTMDHVAHPRIGRARQSAALMDLVDYCQAYDRDLIVRPPPSGFDVFDRSLRAQLSANPRVSIAERNGYLTSPEEAILQADLVVSISSTMLLETRLMGIRAMSLRYIDCEPLWENVGVPTAIDAASLTACAEKLLAEELPPITQHGLAWAQTQFSHGARGFDGGAVRRVASALTRLASQPPPRLPIDLIRRDVAEDSARPVVLAASRKLARCLPTEFMPALGIRHLTVTPVQWRAADLGARLEGESDPRLDAWARASGRNIVELRREDLGGLR